MIKDQLNLFAGRQEAVSLFENLCERQAGEPWSFLPILSLVGPSGYGKSLFIQNLYFHYCNTPSLPHISLDFGRRDAPHDLLNIFGALRNSLRRQRDTHGRALAFPRFDIVYARLKRSEGQEDVEVDEVKELFGEFSDLIGLVGNIHVALGLLLFIVKFIVRLPLLRSLLRWLVEWAYERAGNQPQWRWYQDQVRKFRELNLPDNASVGKIRRRLNEMCSIGGPEREFLIEQILPKAFLADLRYGDSDTESPMLKSGPRYIVIFLDSFEVLLRTAESTARQLLEALALNEYRKRGETDPLLLIVGSEERLPDMSREQLNQHFPPGAEQGHNTVSGVNPQKDPGHIAGRDVPIDIGDSDIFASPVQRDLVDHQVAIGVFVMILNQDVTGFHNLSTSQIQGIYTGVYQNWQQICVCGPNLPIVPISRTVNSGTRFTFEKYILKGVATVPGIGLERATSSGNAVQEVVNNPGSIGYAPLYLASQAHDVTILSIDGQDPHNFSLVQQDVYKFWNIEHMYTRGQGSPLAQSFLDFMSSDDISHLFSQFGLRHLADIPLDIRNKHVLEAQ